jgi:hypothetical protein
MRRTLLEYAISILLLISLCVTGLLGYVQSELELRRFVPHRYAAYTTLVLASIHVYLNAGRLWNFLRRIHWPKRG